MLCTFCLGHRAPYILLCTKMLGAAPTWSDFLEHRIIYAPVRAGGLKYPSFSSHLSLYSRFVIARAFSSSAAWSSWREARPGRRLGGGGRAPRWQAAARTGEEP